MAFQSDAFQADAFEGVSSFPGGIGQAQALIDSTRATGQAQARIANSAYHQVISADTPYGWWRLAEESGTVAYAIRGTNGTYSASGWTKYADTPLPSDSVNKGITGSGSSSQEVTTTATEQTNTFSMEAWVKPNKSITLAAESNSGTAAGTSNTQNYVWFPPNKGASDRGLGLSVGTNGIQAIIHGNSTITPIAQYNATISSTTMNHVVVVLNAKVPKIYLNGALVRTGITASATNVYSPQRMSGDVVGGAGNYGPFSGTMNNAALYSTALTDAKVLAHYNAGLPRGHGQAQAYVRFTAGTGQAQGQIWDFRGYGQAQAFITYYEGTGQAQADIKAVNYGFGQTLGDIKTQNFGFGQAQADIRVFDINASGQSTALITGVKFVQSKVVSAAGLAAGANWSVTLDNAPTAGNLLVVVGNRRSSHSVTLGMASPWVHLATVDQNDGGAMSYRVAAAGMSATITGTWSDGGGANDWSVAVMEFAGRWAGDFITVTTFDSNGVGGTTIPLGPITPKVPFAGVGVVLGNTNDPLTFTNNNSYISILNGLGGQVEAPANYFAYKIIGALGTSQSVTLTASGSNGSRLGILATFSETAYSYGQGQAQARITGIPRQSGQAQASIARLIVQSAEIASFAGGTGTLTLRNPAIAGNLLVIFAGNRGAETTNFPAGFTRLSMAPVGSGLVGASVPNAGYLDIGSKIAAGGETSFNISMSGGTANYRAVILELAVPQTVNNYTAVDNQSATTNHILTGLTAPSGVQHVVIGAFITTAPSGATNTSYTPETGYREFVDTPASPAGNLGPRLVVIGLENAGTVTSYTPDITADNGGVSVKWAGIGLVYTVPSFYGSAQAAAQITGINRGYGQALTEIYRRPDFYNGFGQAQADIAYKRWGSGQSQAYLRSPFAYGLAQGSITNALARASGQARAVISSATKQKFGQAQAKIVVTQGYGQANALIDSDFFFAQAQGTILKQFQMVWGQAQADIVAKTLQSGQAQGFILKTTQSGQAEALIKITSTSSGQAQAFIGHFGVGQAQGYIATVKYLVKFNDHILPGYAQREAFDSEETTDTRSAISVESFTEYTGLKNKTIDVQMKIVGATYVETKQQLFVAGSMFRSTSDWAKLYIQNPDRYYLALPKSLSMEQEATKTAIDYSLQWEAQPWLFSDAIYTVSDTGDFTVVRTLDDGGWTPLEVTVTGTDITLSGYTDTGDFAGFVSISGAVSNFIVTSQPYTSTNPAAMNPDYSLFLSPGTTNIDTTGVTTIVVRWQNRWYI